MADIPPPQKPGSVLMVPFVLADSPRLQLIYLSKHPSIPEKSRKAIAEWLDRYNAKLAGYLRETGGEAAIKRADALSRMAADMMNKRVAEMAQQHEEEVFEQLAKDFFDDYEWADCFAAPRGDAVCCDVHDG